jgi:hypothetical protein
VANGSIPDKKIVNTACPHIVAVSAGINLPESSSIIPNRPQSSGIVPLNHPEKGAS